MTMPGHSGLKVRSGEIQKTEERGIAKQEQESCFGVMEVGRVLT